jgi:hypothetical protein
MMMMKMVSVLLVVVSTLVGMSSAVTKPAGCTYSSGLFTCDYRLVG